MQDKNIDFYFTFLLSTDGMRRFVRPSHIWYLLLAEFLFLEVIFGGMQTSKFRSLADLPLNGNQPLQSMRVWLWLLSGISFQR